MATISLAALNANTTNKINSLEDAVAVSMNTIGTTGTTELSQSDLISLQYKMNALSTYTALITSINKEIADTIKAVVNKI